MSTPEENTKISENMRRLNKSGELGCTVKLLDYIEALEKQVEENNRLLRRVEELEYQARIAQKDVRILKSLP